MLCINCGNEYDETIGLCPNCSDVVPSISTDASTTLSPNNTTSAPVDAALKQPVAKVPSPTLIKAKALLARIMLLIKKYKKTTIAICGVFALFVLIIILFFNFHDFTVLKWDNNKTDDKIKVTGQSSLDLKVIALDKQKNALFDIKYKINGGKVVPNKQEVVWHLPEKVGIYEIIATAPSGKQIKKKISVVALEREKLTGLAVADVEVGEKADADKDGLIDIEEKKYKTNPLNPDTDGDGIVDYIEVNYTKTDPLKTDTDDDGLGDGNEIELGLDPLKDDTKNDGIRDGKRVLPYMMSDAANGVELDIVGKGNIASTTIDTSKNKTLEGLDGAINKLYNFHTPGALDSATVRVKYDIDQVIEKGLNEDSLSLYSFDLKTKGLEKVESVVDKTEKTVTSILKHFSYYIVADSNIVNVNRRTRLMFIIDNSASMYSHEDLLDVNLDFSSHISDIGNDVDLKRLSLSKNMVDGFGKKHEFAVGQFSGRFDLINDFSTNKRTIKTGIDSINNAGYNKGSGTNIIGALGSGIKRFTYDANDDNYIFIMTDGNNTTGNFAKERPVLIKEAQKKGVKVCVVGLGDRLDSVDLMAIASETGCNYYNSTNAIALDEIYKKVGSDINYGLVDTDDDNVLDGILHADSGFVISRDGFSFNNYVTLLSDGGHCYGMAMFAQHYYTKQLPFRLDSINTKGRRSLRYGPEVIADGYDLDNSYFFKNGIQTTNNLYGFGFENEAIRFATYPGKLGNLYDWADIKNGTLKILSEYLGPLSKVGASIRTVELKVESNKSIKKREKALIDTSSSKFKDVVNDDEQQLLSSIYRLYATQKLDSRIGFLLEGDQSYNKLKNDLSNKIPVIVGVHGDHVVNATKIIADIDNPNKFKVEIYDNNHPGEPKYIELIRSKLVDPAFIQKLYDDSSELDKEVFGTHVKTSDMAALLTIFESYSSTNKYTYRTSYEGKDGDIEIITPVFDK